MMYYTKGFLNTFFEFYTRWREYTCYAVVGKKISLFSSVFPNIVSRAAIFLRLIALESSKTRFTTADDKNVNNKNTSELHLELVQVLFRHGERTPLFKEMYPNDPYDMSVYQPFGIGQLTNEGKMRVYRVGKMLRRRYNDFLGQMYHPKDVYARSTDIDRTKTSLQLVLAGLYSPTAAHMWNPNLCWSPIPTHYAPDKADILFKPHNSHIYVDALKEVKKIKEVREKMSAYEELFKFLSTKTGLNITDVELVYEVFNLLVAQKYMKLTLPEWCTTEVFCKMQDATVLNYEILSYTKKLKQLTGGMLIRKMIENMDIKGERNNPRKIYLYSAHEVNIAAFTRAHYISEPKLPGFGSAIIVEKLRNKAKELFVKMFLWTGITEELIPLKLEGCDEVCPLKTYLVSLEDVIPSDAEQNNFWSQIKNEELKNLFV